MATDKDIDSAGAPADDWLCLPLPVLHLDPGGHVRRVNRAASTLLGLTQPLSSNQGIDDFLGLAGRVVFHEHLVPRVRLERELRDVRLPLQLPDGRELSMRAQAGWRRDPQGVESIWLALTADHDPSRRDAELTRVRRAADCSPAMLFEYIVERDGRGRFSYASNALLALFGLVPEQVRDDDQALLDRLHPDDRARWIATRDEAAAQDHVWVLICRTADTAPGPARHVGWRARPQRGEGGATIWHGVVGDVTRLETERLAREQRMADAETARQAMQEMAEDLLDAQPTLLSFWDDGLRLRFANEAFLSLLAVPREQALGRTLHELIGSMPGQRDWPDLGRVLAGETIETQVSGTGGRSHRHWMHAAPSRRHGEIDGCLLVATDISAVVEARQRAENLNAALARTEHFLRLIADSLPARVAYFDRDRICRFANRQYGEWLQRPIDEVIGKTAETLLSPSTRRC